LGDFLGGFCFPLTVYLRQPAQKRSAGTSKETIYFGVCASERSLKVASRFSMIALEESFMIAAAKANTRLIDRQVVPMKLSSASTYALHATLLLAVSRPGIPISCRELARRGKMPERFLLQILRQLVKANILQSSCGVAGGYYLARSPREITLDDIVAASDPPLCRKSLSCDTELPIADDRVAETLAAAAKAVRAEFRKLSLDMLLDSQLPANELLLLDSNWS
jgi:Rrf2 family protein